MSTAAQRLLVRAFLNGFDAAMGRATSPKQLSNSVCRWWNKEYPHEKLETEWVLTLIEEFYHGI